VRVGSARVSELAGISRMYKAEVGGKEQLELGNDGWGNFYDHLEQGLDGRPLP
jgi:hypothetical protein